MALIKVLKEKAREGTITLIYGARDEKHNEALVLKQFLERTNSSVRTNFSIVESGILLYPDFLPLKILLILGIYGPSH